jgi:hypothetical protein
MGKDSSQRLEPLGPPEVRSPDSLHAVALERLRQGRHGRGRTSQFGTGLASYQRIDFCSMVLIIGQTFVNLSPGQVWKAPHNVIDAGTVDDQTDNVVHPDPSALHNRIAPADMVRLTK